MKPKSPKGKKAEAPKEDAEEVKTEATPAEVIVTEAPPAEVSTLTDLLARCPTDNMSIFRRLLLARLKLLPLKSRRHPLLRPS
jgi:hypothetical protein